MFPLIVLLSIQVFGIQLGAEFNAAPCPADPTLITAVCIEPVDKSGKRIVVFPAGARPAIMASDRLAVLVIDGKVEGLSFMTHGTRTQDIDLGTLKTWFGEPESVTYHSPYRTDAPEIWRDIVEAVWNKPDLKIKFMGSLLGGRITEGAITIDTAKGQKERAKS